MWNDMKDLTKWIIFFVVIGAALTSISWFWKYNTAAIQGKVGAEVKIESADSRIYNYEHFFDLCAAVQGYEAAIAAQKEQLLTADNEQAFRIRANIAGVTAQRARAIAQYNADVAKSYTKARFFDDGQLPHTLSVKQGATQCTN